MKFKVHSHWQRKQTQSSYWCCLCLPNEKVSIQLYVSVCVWDGSKNEQQDSIISLCLSKTHHLKNKSILFCCDSVVVKVWLGLATKMKLLGQREDHGFGWNKCFVKVRETWSGNVHCWLETGNKPLVDPSIHLHLLCRRCHSKETSPDFLLCSCHTYHSS